MPNLKMKKMPTNYTCEICNFTSSKMSNYNKHLLTPKHQRLTNPNAKMPSSEVPLPVVVPVVVMLRAPVP